MATLHRFSFLSLFTLSLLIATSSARPCKTLFYFSTTTTTTLNPSNPNLNFPNSFSQIHKPRYFTLVFINPNPTVGQQPQSNFRINSENEYSIKDRTMDIMSVVGALLFGLGCGALTASVMYFVWAIFCSAREVDFDLVDAVSDDEDGDDFDDEEAAAAKKKGFEYVKVAAEDVEKREMV